MFFNFHFSIFILGAACTGYPDFQYTIQTADMEDAELIIINCDESMTELLPNGARTMNSQSALLIMASFLITKISH